MSRAPKLSDIPEIPQIVVWNAFLGWQIRKDWADGLIVVVPGPFMHLKEGQQVSINVVNDTDIDDIIHFVPSEVDGAMEEGSPMIPTHGGSKVYTFTPKPTGTRWYINISASGMIRGHRTDLCLKAGAGLRPLAAHQYSG